ncbi:MAG: Rieske 2Fe-2S domain-containing protein [Gemmatimonadaceae bacterium]
MVERWEPVATAGDLAEGELKAVETPSGARVCLVNQRGVIYAVANNCTHQDFPMSEGVLLPREGRCVIECAWHGAQFDCASGAVLKHPAEDPIATFDVKTENGRVVGARRAAVAP